MVFVCVLDGECVHTSRNSVGPSCTFATVLYEVLRWLEVVEIIYFPVDDNVQFGSQK